MNVNNYTSQGSRLSAPFPFFGGKSRLAAQIWAKLGNPTVYVEPCYQTLGIGWRCLTGCMDQTGARQREITCDLDGNAIVSFWQAEYSRAHDAIVPFGVIARPSTPTYSLCPLHKWSAGVDCGRPPYRSRLY